MSYFSSVRISLLAGLFLLPALIVAQKKPSQYVDPMIGTSDTRWMLFPGPTMPFGMVKLSPDNRNEGHHAGYDYNVNTISGFSHIHTWAMGGLLTMPTNGLLRTQPGDEKFPEPGYRSAFDHESEKASVGYYSVLLKKYGIKAELTSTTRTGFQRYTFPASSSSRILFDLQIAAESPYNVDWASIKKINDYEIEGFSKQSMFMGFANLLNEYTVYFVAKVDKPMRSFGTWVNGSVDSSTNYCWGRGDVGAFLNFDTKENEVIRLKTAISFVSIEQARKNLEMESEPFGWDFDKVKRNAEDEWDKILGTIQVEDNNENNKRKFYTNLYRAYSGRTIFSDANGKWVDMCEQVQQLPDPAYPMMGSDAFWGTFWNLNSLWTLATPDVANQWVRSFLEMSDKGGWLPNGPTGLEYCDIMVANHEVALMNSAFQKGIRNYDVNKAYAAMRKVQDTQGEVHPCGGLVGNRQLDIYKKMGYVPGGAKEKTAVNFFGNQNEGPASNTLAYAFDDWNVAQMAKALGKKDDYDYFTKRAYNYRNVFDTSIRYFRRKDAAGKWMKFHLSMNDAPEVPSTWLGFVEGNSWQYSFFLPHDMNALVNMVGRDTFNARLVKGFELTAKTNFYQWGSYLPGVSMGNQPNMQAPFLFNYSGKPWLTQYWSREVMNRYFGDAPSNGWPGDEDEGQGGSYFTMSALGLFEMDGGGSTKPVYTIGSPLFKKVTIRLDKRYYTGKTFTIECINNSDVNRYIQSATLNGKKLDRTWFYHSDLVKGGSLVLVMGPTPNLNWGSAEQLTPPSMSTEK